MVGTFGLRPKGTMSARALPIARELVRRGHTVRMIVPPWDYPADSGRRETVDGVEIEYLDVPRVLTPPAYAGITARMLRSVRAARPDVVYAFKPKGFGGLVSQAYLAARGRGRAPRVVLDSDDWEGDQGWNQAAGYSPLQQRVFAWQERQLLRRADAVTAASRDLERRVRKLHQPNVRYVSNAVDLADWPASPDAKPADPPTILLYTRFVEFDPARVIRVLKSVRDSVPAARLLIVGQGLRGEETTLLAAAGEQALTSAVELSGWIAFDRLPAVLQRAWVAVVPFDDTVINRTKSSVKLLELMACGIPVVADAVGQNAVVIEDGVSGRLVPPGQEEAMARAVVDLLQNPGTARDLGRAARHRIETHYQWPQAVDIVEQVLCG
jgi:glycosyltransferase involved in cell wall biosynthesis